MSTPAPAAPRSDTTGPPGTSKAPAPPLAMPELIRWQDPAVAAAAIAVVIAIVGATVWHHPLVVAAGIGLAMVTVGVAILTVRENHRRTTVAHLANKAAAQLKTPLAPIRTRWGWRGWPGRLTVLVVRYPASALAAMGDDTPRRIASALSAAAGPDRAASVKRHWAGRQRLTVHFRPVDPGSDTPDAAEQRVADVVTDTVGSNGHAVDITTSDTGEIASFAIAMTKAARFTEPSVQRRLSKAVTSRLDGRWKINFNLQNDRIEFTRRVPLPTSIVRPVTPLTADNETRIPEAIDEDGEVHWWDVSGVLAHHLRAGRTRTGKTVAMAGDLVEAARRGWQVFVIDPKRIEFMGWRGWPNVAMVATRLEDQVALINHLHSLMEERYRLIEEDGATEADFHRVLVIIDEYRQFYALVKAWWSSIKVQGMPNECPAFEQVGSMLRMAAAARIHILLATQRPDAEFLKGEALAIDTPVPTPTGWTTMGELTPGDEVLDEHGQPVRVRATTPVMTQRDCYRVTFSDRTTVVADANHLWEVTSATQRAHVPTPVGIRPGQKGRFPTQRYRASDVSAAVRTELESSAASWSRDTPQIRTTAELEATLRYGKRANWSVRVTAPVDLPRRELPIDPWLLGLWLGDGHKATATTAIERIEQLGYRVPARYNYGAMTGSRRSAAHPHTPRAALRQLGILNNKHIPVAYLRASHHQRAELLAGLLDSDGWCNVHGGAGRQSGQVSVTNSDRRLIEQAAELVASLGFIASITRTRVPGTESGPTSVALGRNLEAAWKVTFTPDRKVFGIGRKQELRPSIHQPRNPRTRRRYIVDITAVPSVPVRCISVDSPTSLFLVTKAFLPTHNCRDNFSARSATGRLGPDGAQMMFDSQHIGVSTPEIQGRGTIVGLDDHPKEVQFFYTPNPRKATSEEERQLLRQLRPTATTWLPQAFSYPDVESVKTDIAAGDRKTAVEWEQIRQAHLAPADTLDPATAASPSAKPAATVVAPAPMPPRLQRTTLNNDVAPVDAATSSSAAEQDEEEYLSPQRRCPTDLKVGDLVEFDGRWVCVHEPPESVDDTVEITWRNNDDHIETTVVSDDETLNSRRPTAEGK